MPARSPAPSCARAPKRRSRTTRALADIVARVVHARPGMIHPATRTFQALRIFVNEELDELAAALQAAERILAPGGRLVVVVVPLARRPDREVVPRGPLRPGRRLAPPAGDGEAARRPSGCSPASRTCRTMPRSPPIRARARPSCAPPSAPMRRPAQADAGGAAAVAVAARGDGGAAMIMRLLNICVIVALVLAAVDVYTIKFESTRQAQRLAKLRHGNPARERRHRRPARRVGAARHAGAHPGAGQPSSHAEADRCLAVRQARQPAGAAARSGAARRARSDRLDDREPGTRRPDADREHPAAQAAHRKRRRRRDDRDGCRYPTAERQCARRRGRRAVAPAARAHLALRRERRSRREGAGAASVSPSWCSRSAMR